MLNYSGNKEDQKTGSIKSLDHLIQILRLLFESDNIDVNLVKNILHSYKSNPNDWVKYAHFDQFKYTRNLVDSGNDKYNLILVCWAEGQGSVIHDHSDAHCFMKMLSGSLHETRYEWPDSDINLNEMKVIDENVLKNDSVAYINDSIGLHRVENRSHTIPAVSLHLYTPPYSKCQTFDERTGFKNEVNVNYHTKYGKQKSFLYKQFKQLHEFGIDWQ